MGGIAIGHERMCASGKKGQDNSHLTPKKIEGGVFFKMTKYYARLDDKTLPFVPVSKVVPVI